MQRHVHEDLIEGPIEESGIHRDHRMQAAHGKPSRRGHSMLFGDTDVEAAIGKRPGKPVQPCRIDHRCGNGDDSLVVAAQPKEFLGEQLGPGLASRSPDGLAGNGVDLADGVEAILFMVLGGLETVALARDAMHQDRTAEPLGLPQRTLHLGNVVTIDWPDVLQAQVREQPLRCQHVLQPDLDAMQDVVRGVADQGRPADTAFHQLQKLLVARVGAQPRQASCHPSDRRGVGPAVVVHYDHQRQVVGGSDVVQGLPSHPAGEGTVADKCDHGARLILQPNGLGQSVGVRERG